MLSGQPSDPVVMPRALQTLAGATETEWVWQNELGGLTMRFGDERDVRYVKWSPPSSGLDLADEARRLRWASSYLRVPEVLEVGADDEGTWMVSRAINAQNAVSTTWAADPERATWAIGSGLRRLHDALPVRSCPFEWSRERRLQRVEERYAKGLYVAHSFGYELVGLDVDRAMAILRDAPEEDLVVCHGDACAPNTLLDQRGECVGHVDLGRLGVGDRWADLAVASWSAVWNYGAPWERTVIDAYGLEPDLEKIRYYRILWELD